MKQDTWGNEINTEIGKIIFDYEFLANIAGISALDCDGIAGMSSRNIKDGISDLFGRENLSRGVEIHFSDEQLYIELFVVVRYGSIIKDVAANVIKKVKRTIEEVTGLQVAEININVQGIQTDHASPQEIGREPLLS